MYTREDLARLVIPNTTETEQDTIRDLFHTWQTKLAKNQQRTLYYDGEQAFKDLGLMLPPQLKNAKFILGWATMAVRKAAIRSQFKGLRLPGSNDPLELAEVFETNDFALEFAQATVSAYKHGCAFVTVTSLQDGPGPVEMRSHSAETATALWDGRRRRPTAALTITKQDQDANPTEFRVYLDHIILHCEKTPTGWTTTRYRNDIGQTPVVPVTYDPQLSQPFGRSRISNPVMSLTDMAVRAYVRMEGNAEFYSSPQIAIENISPDQLASGDASAQAKFRLAMDRLIGLTKDADGDVPQVKQLQQATMAPHNDMIRTVAMAFTGETGIPPASLGIIHDNPSSAEAIRAAEHDLLIDVTYQNDMVLSGAVKRIARLAVMVRDGLAAPPAEASQLSAQFVDPEFRSVTANADAALKLAALPQLSGSNVVLDGLLSEDQIGRVLADQRRATASAVLDRLNTQAQQPESEQRAMDPQLPDLPMPDPSQVEG